MKYLLLSLPLALMACVKPECVVYVNGKPIYDECYQSNGASTEGRNTNKTSDKPVKQPDHVESDDNRDDSTGSNSNGNNDDSNGDRSNNQNDDSNGDNSNDSSDDSNGGRSKDNSDDSNGGKSREKKHK